MLFWPLEDPQMDENELKQKLLMESAEFRKIHEEHQTLEHKIEAIRRKTYLTEADTVDEREFKKRKLALKDRMYRMMAQLGKKP